MRSAIADPLYVSVFRSFNKIGKICLIVVKLVHQYLTIIFDRLCCFSNVNKIIVKDKVINGHNCLCIAETQYCLFLLILRAESKAEGKGEALS